MDTASQCNWTRLPDIPDPLELRRVQFNIGCNGETARGVYPIYPDWCPSCRQPVVISNAENGPAGQP